MTALQLDIAAGDAVARHIGPYRITGMLGRGGMGVVYRGEHVRTSELAAVKTVITSSGSVLAGIRREILALRRIQHRGVVRIVEEGVWEGLPWYAMELLQGSTLRTHINLRAVAMTDMLADTVRVLPSSGPGAALAAAPPRATEELPALLAMVGNLCAPLAYLHGNGIVHRDLKPENIFIQPDGFPVLVDFGISAQFCGARGREELSVDRQVIGSISYMAPEQIRGELSDPRADLYALGCILYECVTGHPPFVGVSFTDVLEKHLHQLPAPPSRSADGVPAGLDHLILTLLAKRPRDRLGYASDVARALAALGVRMEELRGSPEPQAYLYRPELIGRGEVLTAMETAVDELARSGTGGQFFLGGESGVGKTRIALEIATRAARMDLLVVTGQASSLSAVTGGPLRSTAAQPLSLFRPLLETVADRCREHGASEAERLLGWRGKVLSIYEPSLAALAGQGAQPDAPELEPQAARARVLSALKETILELARSAPLVLVLDDLQWADDLSLSLVRELGTGAGARGILLIGTYRMEEMGEELAALAQAEGARSFCLGRLDGESVGAMTAGMLALPEAPRKLVDFLRESSDGNPFFIAEYLMAAIGAGLLTRSAAGEWLLGERGGKAGSLAASVPLPRTLAALIERRLSELGEPRRRLVEIAAVLGREIDIELLAAIARADDATVMEALEALRVRQIIEEPGPGRLRFVHDKIREAAYERIPADRRRDLHRRAAESLEARGGVTPDRLPALAHHFASGGVHAKASLYHGLAGDAARSAYANGDAIASYRAAIRAAHEALREGARAEEWGERICQLEESLGDVLALAGQQAEARAAYDGALARVPARERVRRARIHRKQGTCWETHHKQDEAQRAYLTADEELGATPAEEQDGGWWQEWIQVQIDRIRLHYWAAQVDEMMALAERVRPAVDRRGAARHRVQLFQTLARVNFRRERYRLSAETVQYASSALAAIEESGALADVAEGRFFLAFALLFHGRLDEATAHMLRAVEEMERVGDVAQRARCLTYLTVIYRRRGLVEETHAAAERSLAASLDGQMSDYIGAAKANLAWVAWRRGQAAEAARDARAGLEIWGALQLVYPLQWMARLPLAALCRDGGELREAIEIARPMLDSSQQLLPESFADALGRMARAWTDGEVERARSALDQALVEARALGFA
ncbi:protein kinase [Sorangium sp. So ce136]|uniref:serine/threonine-protein kinase n=1 Tax=Sorangium sp. So ce136 TaxID=3133284 RepID=UPI003F05F562